jgi:protein-disulfide isomerase
MNDFISALTLKYAVDYRLKPFRFELDSSGAPGIGPETAEVTIVEFSDFQCPYCARYGPILKRLVDEYPNQVRVVFKQFPIASIHPQARKAAEASLCAGDQGKFWEMHDAMFENQSKLAVPQLKELATTVGLDTTQFNQCLDSGRHFQTVSKDLQDAMKVGVSGTPAFFVNGRPLKGSIPYETIAKLVEEELKLNAPESVAAADE